MQGRGRNVGTLKLIPAAGNRQDSISHQASDDDNTLSSGTNGPPGPGPGHQ